MFKDNFTNLEQSKWLKEFFEKHENIKRPSVFAFRYTEYYENGEVVGEPTLVVMGDGTELKLKNDFYIPAYLLSQLEGILPNPLQIGSDYWELKWWRHDGYYYEGITACPNPFKIEVNQRKVIADPFQNIIELLKLLDEKGCFGKGEA